MPPQTFQGFLTLVEFLVEVQGKPIEDALVEARVPLQYLDQIRAAMMMGPVEISPPDIIDEAQSMPMCRVDEGLVQPFTDDFLDFMLDERRWDRSTVARLAETSKDLVSRLPMPRGADEFRTRGLVIGYIQSGKTASMASLIARAADQGYKLIVILAGIMKDLRAQTQRRMDQEIVGHSDNPESDGPFVKHNHQGGVPLWGRLTQSGLDGDFQPGTLDDLNPLTPKLAVLKKNVRVLERFADWLRRSRFDRRDLPALVIDDEADQASIDTNYGKLDEYGDPIDPTKTNQAIRDLLNILPKCVYVGFTATPFANVLIDISVEDDLFPRHFIASLPEPVGYLGPRQLFGLGLTPSDLSDEPAEPPLIDIIHRMTPEQIDEIEDFRLGGQCPTVLSEALWMFLLSCCARLARGQSRSHFSMLVHPSQRTMDHALFASALSEEIDFLRQVVNRPRTFPGQVKQARRVWEEDFMKLTDSIGDPSLKSYDFETIWAFAPSVAEQLELKVLNKDSVDELDYTGGFKRYVVVGGNRLSRGLTLEGLSVSVFLRSTNYYDTLLQMGRWFGFRPSYQDLTRIFVEPQMAASFADLARVELELREDLRKYAREPNPLTPAELAPRIRAHPTLAVTSPSKMGAGRQIGGVWYEASTQNTVNFPVHDRGALQGNQDAARAFIAKLGEAKSESPYGLHLWRDVPVARVREFLWAYSYGPGAQTVNRLFITSYIDRLNQSGELVSWDVVIPHGNKRLGAVRWTDTIFSRLVIRAPMTETSIPVLQSPEDIRKWRKLTQRSIQDSTHGCIMLYMIDKDSGEKLKFGFRAGQSEDILGFVLVFPKSNLKPSGDFISQHHQ